jgi:hypothetical protein
VKKHLPYSVRAAVTPLMVFSLLVGPPERHASAETPGGATFVTFSQVAGSATAIPGGTGTFTDFPYAPSVDGGAVALVGTGAGGTTGVHTIEVVKFSSATSDPPIDASPTDAATTGNQFRLTDAATGEWHFNLSTTSLSRGTWQIKATLSDGSVHTAYIELK